MALEELRKDIEHDARLAASRLDSEGTSEAKAIIENARRSANEMRKKSSESANAEVEQRRRESIISLDMEISAIQSAAKEESIERQSRQFSALVAKKLEQSEDAIIKSAMRSFSALMPLEHAAIRISKRNSQLAKNSGARIEISQIRGVVITSADKKVTADASIDGLIESHGDVMRRVLSKAMFG